MARGNLDGNLQKIATYTSEGNDIKELAFLTRELRACARASYRYDMENGTRSLDWSIPVNFFSILGF